MSKDGFDLAQLLYDIVNSTRQIRRWQDVEQIVVDCCKKQDPGAIHNHETDPDVLLSNGFGIEAKSTSSLTRGINLNSAAPCRKTFYAVVYHSGGRVKNVALVNGQNFYCSEIAEICKTNTRLRQLSNQFVRYRTRIMWQVDSPFKIWGKGNFVVDKLSVVHRY